MARKKHDEDEEQESLGSDLEQMVAMLEKAEIDYDVESDDEGESSLTIQDEVVYKFDEDGTLLEINVIQ